MMTKEQIIKELREKGQRWASDHYYKTFLQKFLNALNNSDIVSLEELSTHLATCDFRLLDRTTWPINKDNE